jgi:hypothetical protein
VTLLWSWDASAGSASGCGVSDDPDRARRAAAEWMRAHDAATAVLERVRLGAWAGGFGTVYEHTGDRLQGTMRRGGRVTWSRARELEAS